MDIMLEYAFACIFIGAFAYQRTTGPVAWRSSTTAARYWIALALYAALIFGVSYAIARVLAANPVLVNMFPADQRDWVKGLLQTSTPLASALLFTTLLNVPFINSIDSMLHKIAGTAGAIPARLDDLVQRTLAATWHLPEHAQKAVGLECGQLGLGVDAEAFDRKGPLEHKWCEIMYLAGRLKRRSRKSVRRFAAAPSQDNKDELYKSFVLDWQWQYNHSMEMYSRQARLATLLLGTTNEPAANGDLVRMRALFEVDCNTLLEGLVDLTCQDAMRSRRTLRSVYREVARCGFEDMELGQVPYALMGVCFALTVVWLGAAYVFLFNRDASGSGMLKPEQLWIDVHKAFWYSLPILLALLSGVCVGASTRTDKSDPEDGLLRWSYAGAGLLAVAGWLAVHIVQKGAWSVDQILGRYSHPANWEWALVPFAVAYGVAALTDWAPDQRRLSGKPLPAWTERLVDGIVMGLALAAVGVIITFLPPIREPFYSTLLRRAVLLFGVGLLVGIPIPSATRNSRQIRGKALEARKKNKDSREAVARQLAPSAGSAGE